MATGRKNADRLDKLFDFMQFKRFDDSIANSFFVGDSGYFLFGVEPHALFLLGHSSLEKLQKYRWLRVDRDTEEADIFQKNGFMLFYDKSGLVRRENELRWLRYWRQERQGFDKATNAKLNSRLKQVPNGIVQAAIEKMTLWHEKKTEAFPLPSDWDSVKLSQQQLIALYKTKKRKRSGQVGPKKGAKRRKVVKEEYSSSEPLMSESSASEALTGEAPEDPFGIQWEIDPLVDLAIAHIDYDL